MFDIMTLCETPSVLMNLLRSRCVVVLVKFLNVLAHDVNMVRGKPSSRLDRGVDIPITLSLEIGFYLCLCCAIPRVQGGSWCPAVGESDPIHKPE